ncbi:MAG: hypothetical protein M3M96_07610 [Candidatus Eremiobacteraeota bacterium]|nr:hypothetical protein [Candidatus Eremiobacteraeota bacterium]
MIERIARAGLVAASVAAIAACSAGGTGGPSITSVVPGSPNYSSLQFAVGTANLYGASTGLNVVSTFRQTNGRSATGVNTPTITGPFAITAGAVPSGGTGNADPYTTALTAIPAPGPENSVPGPSLSEKIVGSSAAITGTPQTVTPGTPDCDGVGAPAPFVACPGGIAPNTTTFGQSGGVFAMGIAPYNHAAPTGQAYSYQPYTQPFYDASHAGFIPWGGPPAFDPNGTKLGERDGVGSINGVDAFGAPYFLGVAEGITMFGNVTASTGTYTLNVAIATVGNGGAVSTTNVTKTATLGSIAILPTLSAPVVAPDANGDGGATFNASLPSGVTEAYVQIVDYGPGGGPNNGHKGNAANCQGPRGTAFAPVYYTVHVTSATTAYSIPATIGPNLATAGGTGSIVASPSLCTAAQNTAASGSTTPGDDFIVQIVGFDYPIYQAALGLTQSTTPQNPSIANALGQADVTLSIPMEQDGGGAPVPAIRSLHFQRRR